MSANSKYQWIPRQVLILIYVFSVILKVKVKRKKKEKMLDFMFQAIIYHNMW